MTNPEDMKVALVTGAGKRIGRSICEALATAGYAIALHYRSSEAEAKTLSEQLNATGTPTSLHQADLANRDDIDCLSEEIHMSWGKLHLLVNSASLFESVALADISQEDLDKHFQINCTGPLFLCRNVHDLLQASAPSTIINVTDIYARIPLRNHIAYTMSKAALEMLTRSLASEWAADGITVNAIAPGAILFPDEYPKEQQTKIRERIPLKREGSPEDIARTVLYLAASPFVTGQVITIDGGRSLGK